MTHVRSSRIIWPTAYLHRSLGHRPRESIVPMLHLAEGHIHDGGRVNVNMAVGQMVESESVT